jgi:protein TonB
MFEQSILATPRGTARPTSFVASLGAQALLLGTALLIPLFLIEQPQMARLTAGLQAPPPPPPPPGSFVKLVPVPMRFIPRAFDGLKLYAPVRIPPKAELIDDGDLPLAGAPALQQQSTGWVPGGIPGSIGTFTGERFGSAPPPPPPAPPAEQKVQRAAEKPSAPIRVGGDVQAAKIINRAIPVYPPLAKAARISGTVRLIGIISKDGKIQQLQVVSGHPLLVAAALEAVKRWLYQPTLLNGEPVEVVAPIDVHFNLSQ